MAKNQPSSQMIMIITIIVAIILVLIIWPLSMIGKGSTLDSNDDAELRILPVARIEMQQVAATSDGKPRSGESIYNTVCMACHASGAAGAPKTGDKAAWAPRLAAGIDALLQSASNGKGNMPPRGGASDLSDAELRSAVEFLTGKAK